MAQAQWGLRWVRADRPRSTDRHRGRDGRGPTNKGMRQNGYHRHLHLYRQRLQRLDQDPQRQGPVELGAAWEKVSNEGRDYLSVKLDDPSFPAPIHATLVEGKARKACS